MHWLVALFALATISCVPVDTTAVDSKPLGADGHYFETKEYSRPENNVRLVYYASSKALNAAYHARMGTVQRVAGFTVYFEGGCEIHVIDPSTKYAPEYIGHELLHCFHGNFHPEQLKKAERRSRA